MALKGQRSLLAFRASPVVHEVTGKVYAATALLMPRFTVVHFSDGTSFNL